MIGILPGIYLRGNLHTLILSEVDEGLACQVPHSWQYINPNMVGSNPCRVVVVRIELGLGGRTKIVIQSLTFACRSW